MERPARADAKITRTAVPVWLPEIPWPEVPYVPGRSPRPSQRAAAPHGLPADWLSDSPEPWWRCRGYLRGLDLFNHGDYWEAHEAWEAVWHVAGRQGPTAALLKGLIKLAAAGVKTRAGSWRGRRRHCRRAVDLFQRLAEREAPPDTPGGWLGLSPTCLAQQAAEAAEAAPFASPAADSQVFHFRLVPGDSAPNASSGRCPGFASWWPGLVAWTDRLPRRG